MALAENSTVVLTRNQVDVRTVTDFCTFLDWSTKSELQEAIEAVKTIADDGMTNMSHRRICKNVLKLLRAELREFA